MYGMHLCDPCKRRMEPLSLIYWCLLSLSIVLRLQDFWGGGGGGKPRNIKRNDGKIPVLW